MMRLINQCVRALALSLLWVGTAGFFSIALGAEVAERDREFLTEQERVWLSSNAGNLRVAPEVNYPPFSFSQSGVWRGMSSDFLHLIEGRLGVTFQVLPGQNLDAILKQTRNGDADIVTSIKSTPEREQFLAFTPPYVKVPTVVVTRSKSTLGKWPESFVGKNVAVGSGYGVQQYLAATYPLITLTPVQDDLEGLRNLAFGNVDAVIMDIASASYFIEQENITGLRVHSEFEYEYDLSFAVRKDMLHLRDVLTKGLLAIPEKDKQAVMAKWIRLDRNPMELLRTRIQPWLPLIFLIAAALSGGAMVAILGRQRRLKEALAATLRLEEANQQLFEQQAFIRTIADALPSMIGYWGNDLHCKFANRAYETSFSPKVTSIVGLRLKDFADEPFVRAHESRMQAALAGQLQAFQREMTLADGQTMFQAVQYIPHLLNGQVLGFFVLVENITDLKLAAGKLEGLNEELAVQVQRAQSANLAKSAFLANMSHEIRTPLAAISGMARLIRRDPLSVEQVERLDKLEAAARHLNATINDILDMSKIEAEKLVLEELPVNVHRLVTSVVDIVLEKAKEKGLQLHTDIDRTAPALIGDETRLRQVLLNFAGNAVKFTETGSITIRAKVMEDLDESTLLRMEVEDTGLGISPAMQGTLFEPFVQADHTTTREFGGTGLGLAIARRLAHVMGGEVGLESEAGKGSTFWLTVRLKKSADIQPPPVAGASSNAPESIRLQYAGQRVLLVDDDEFNREIGSILLQDVGLLVDLAFDGQAAVDMACRNAYVLILMDLQMPKMDGLQATRQIRSVPGLNHIPVVAMTANAFNEDRMLCLDAGMDDYVTKPVDPKVLYETLLRHLSGRVTQPDTE